MLVVLDTNCVISGLFWRGPARTVLDHARSQRIRLFTSPHLIAELNAVLSRPKFAARLAAAQVSPAQLVIGYASLAHVINCARPTPPVCRDPDDDEVLGCAQAASAQLIITGDKDLRVLQRYGQARIVSAPEALVILAGLP